MAFVDHSASVLVVAASREAAAPVLDYLFDQGIAFGFSRPSELAYATGRLDAIYRMAVVLDLGVGDRVRDAAQALSRELPCVLVSDTPVARREEFRAVLHTDTSPAELFDSVRGVLAGKATGSGLTGSTPAMRHVHRLIERVANKGTTVLLLGESGVGKEVAARDIHRRSGRQGDFVVVDCGALRDEALDAVLFGEPGPRSTGTGSGYFQMAEGGTLLLDEVADLSLACQARLLRVLEDGRYKRVGEPGTQARDVRIIAASRRNLVDVMETGAFRNDLFFQLAVFPIRLPPLRERIADMTALIEALGAGLPGGRPRFDAIAMARLKSYGWPGNIRELSNVIERLAILYPHETVDRGTLDAHLHPLDVALMTPESLPDGGQAPATQISAMALPSDGVDLRELVEHLEKRLIEQALDRNDRVVAHAARALGLRRTTLTEKLRRYGISSD
ncbi:response regulator [Salinisphaera dokdonensis CL-ES53]|uniref:Response regulator n=1 Tax=Salinisphaera dokdonensis CL-ES53 TaxID=1304272 RepID=A0ABV2B1X7_9GAMM